MNFRTKQLLILVLAVIIVVPSQAVHARINDVINKSFSVSEGGTLTIDANLGSLEVTTSGRNTVDVEIIRELRTNNRDDADEILEDFEVDFSHDGDDVTIVSEYFNDRSMISRFFSSNNRRINIKYKVSVPEKYNIDLKTSGGSISVEDIEGTVNCKTSGGSLNFGNVVGPVWGRTSGGSITLNDCSGDVDVHTSGGRINIGRVDGVVIAKSSGGSITIERAEGSVTAHTSGGSIKVEEVSGHIEAHTSGGSVTAHISSQPGSDCKLTTSGGSVNVYLANNINCDVNAKTSGGRVNTEIPVSVTGELRKNALNAQINDGGPELYLRTSGGSINIKEL
ncbi:DUF4097 domain-containing protein [Candidatus Latescibacterota bacterium]